MGDRHLDLHQMAGITFKIRAAHQRPVDPGRGNLQPIGAVDRIGDIEHRRQRLRDRLTILDLHRSVRPFRHDLDRAAGLAGYLDPYQPVTHSLQHRSGHRRHPRRRARLDDEARLGKQIGVYGTSGRIGHVQCQNLPLGGLASSGLARRSGLRWVAPGLEGGPAGLPEPARCQMRRAGSGNKKERVPGGPLSIRDRMRTISCG